MVKGPEGNEKRNPGKVNRLAGVRVSGTAAAMLDQRFSSGRVRDLLGKNSDAIINEALERIKSSK